MPPPTQRLDIDALYRELMECTTKPLRAGFITDLTNITPTQFTRLLIQRANGLFEFHSYERLAKIFQTDRDSHELIPTDVAIALLKRASTLNQYQINSFLLGKNGKYESTTNLFVHLLRRYPATVAMEALRLVLLLDEQDQGDLFYIPQQYPGETIGTYARQAIFQRLDSADFVREFVKTLYEYPEAKKWITHSSESHDSIAYLMAKHQNKKAWAYLMEQESFAMNEVSMPAQISPIDEAAKHPEMKALFDGASLYHDIQQNTPNSHAKRGYTGFVNQNRGILQAKYSGGNTLLHIACEKNHLTAIGAFSALGANPQITNDGGVTPLQLAFQHNPTLYETLNWTSPDLMNPNPHAVMACAILKEITRIHEQPAAFQVEAQQRLGLFLMSANAPALIHALNEITWSSTLRTTLDITLLRALLNPCVFTTLSLDAHNQWIDFFTNPEARAQLATLHFKTTDLTQLPEVILNKLSTFITLDALFEISGQRKNPILLALALAQCTIEITMHDTLMTRLADELTHWGGARHGMRLAELKITLNLIAKPKLKAQVRHLIQSQPQDSSIQHALHALIQLFSEASILPEEGLFRDILLEMACTPQMTTNLSYAPALQGVLRQCTAMEAGMMIDAHLNEIDSLPHELHERMLSGLAANPLHHTMLATLFRWSLACHEVGFDDELLVNYINDWVRVVPPEHWYAVDEVLDNTPNPSTYGVSLRVLKEGVHVEGADVEGRLSMAMQYQDETLGLTLSAALVLISSYAPVLRENLLSKDSQVVVDFIAHTLAQLTLSAQHELILALPSDMVSHLLRHSLSGLSSDNVLRADVCQTLLTLISQMDLSSKDGLSELVLSELGANNLTCLGSNTLIELATHILNQPSQALDKQTQHGVWIQRLLTSPDFVANSTPEALHQLSLRYRFISLSLKQDEFDGLTRWIKGEFHFAKPQQDRLMKLQHEMMQDPTCRTHLMEKRARLLTFRADDSLRALFNQLESACLSRRITDEITANKALTSLYTHYHQQLSSLRVTWLVHVSDKIYQTFKRGDLVMAKHTLFRWLEKHVPHRNFEQNELFRKQQVGLYDKEGQSIGFLNESHYAMTFVDDTPIPLIETNGMKAGFVCYDNNRQRMGVLTRTGELQIENLFQKDTSARLLSTLPAEELTQATEVPAALDLLFHDVLLGNQLDTLYGHERVKKGTETRAWLEREVSARLMKSKQPLSIELIESLAMHHDVMLVLELLGRMESKENNHRLWETILGHNPLRDRLFSEGQEFFNKYLKKSCAHERLADYLVQHHDKAWFHDGLSLFLNATPMDKRPALLVDALAELTEGYGIMEALMNTACAPVVLTGFLNDKHTATLQASRTSCMDEVTSYLCVSHVARLISALNKMRDPFNSAQYRLLMMAFAAHNDTLLPEKELRLSTHHAWHEEDVRELAYFLKRHLVHGGVCDKDLAIAHTLLSGCALRCANSGHVALFYHESGRLNNDMMQYALKRGLMDRAVAYGLSFSWMKGVKDWLMNEPTNTNEITDYLARNKAMTDWKAMEQSSWEVSEDGRQLFLLSLYLMHYSGEAEPLVRLLDDIFQTSGEKAQSLHDVSYFMSRLPKHQVSGVIFNRLETLLTANPHRLDKTLLSHLAMYRASKEGVDEKLSVIRHFGQQKNYPLVMRACEVLLLEKPGCAKRIHQIKLEARVEHELSAHQDRWYFGLYQWMKRTWNYGWSAPTGFVRFCDHGKDGLITSLPRRITTPEPSGATIAAEKQLCAQVSVLRDMKARLGRIGLSQEPTVYQGATGYEALFKPIGRGLTLDLGEALGRVNVV